MRSFLPLVLFVSLSGCGRIASEHVPPAPAATSTGGPTAPDDARGCGPRALDCEGGECVGGACRPVILASGIDPGRIAHDEHYVYAVDTVVPSVYRVPKGGGALEIIARPDQVATALLLVDGSLFFSAGHSLFSMDPGGGATQMRATFATTPDALAALGPLI